MFKEMTTMKLLPVSFNYLNEQGLPNSYLKIKAEQNDVETLTFLEKYASMNRWPNCFKKLIFLKKNCMGPKISFYVE